MKHTMIDDYGRTRIQAPKNTYLKGYMVLDDRRIEHCLIDQFGLVLTRGRMGWTSLQGFDYIGFIMCPTPVAMGNDGWNNHCWSWEDWYERNWLCDSWAWLYMKGAKFRDLAKIERAA